MSRAIDFWAEPSGVLTAEDRSLFVCGLFVGDAVPASTAQFSRMLNYTEMEKQVQRLSRINKTVLLQEA